MPPVGASFFSSVTTNADPPLDHSGGRVHLINGDFFYSPNSQRNVYLPLLFNDIPFRSCFHHDFAEFQQPLWWHPACPYLAFVPLRPVFAGVPFQDIFHMSYFPRLRYGGFEVDPQIILGWARLEKDIRDSVHLLLIRASAPAITWIAPTSLGCTGSFKRVDQLRSYFINSRNWFSLFMGCLSYAIAVSITVNGESLSEEIPDWFSFLTIRAYSQIWLSGIRSSAISMFDPSIDRVGVFVQLLHRHREQYSVDWLCRFAVPV